MSFTRLSTQGLSAIVIAGWLAGCGMTDTVGAEAGDPSRALILGASQGTALFSPRPVIIKAVDGRKVAATADSVRVSPGVHVLTVTCVQSLFSRNTHDITVNVEAGETYSLRAEIRPDKIRDGTAACEAELIRDNP